MSVQTKVIKETRTMVSFNYPESALNFTAGEVSHSTKQVTSSSTIECYMPKAYYIAMAEALMVIASMVEDEN